MNVLRCVKQDHRFTTGVTFSATFNGVTIKGSAMFPPQPVYEALPVNRTFYILLLMPFHAHSKNHTVCDSFLFQFLVTVMMVRERKSQIMSGCHATKVFSTTFIFSPHDSRWTPTVTPAEICTHSFSACLSLMGLSQTSHDSWALSPK